MDADASIEEGEIVDDGEDNYTPLERPCNYSTTLTQARFPPPPEIESEEEYESSSDSDSDSDPKTVKRPKLKLKPQVVRSKNTARKKYDIWSTHVQEDVLLENLVNCDVSQVDRSRSVETYPIHNQLPVPPRKNNKRTRDDRNKSYLRLNRRSSVDNDNDVTLTGVPRTILDVAVTIDDTEENIAKDIANKLYEEKEDLIRTIVDTAGKAKALEIFKETKRIEEGGGMLIMNQTRRRTPGGVFLFLVKHDNHITREQQIKIFDDERVKHKKEVREKRKIKLQQIKQRIAASKRDCESSLPELLTRAELCVQELTDEKSRTRRASEDVDVKNPPPSPVTDGHDNSTDGMESIIAVRENHIENCLNRNIVDYDDDCIDVGVDMELF